MEYQGFRKRVVGGVDHAHGNVNSVARIEFPFFVRDPLYAAAAEYIEDFLHAGVAVEFVGLTRCHGYAHHGQLPFAGESVTHKPFVFLVPGPLYLGIAGGDKAQGIVHQA